MKTTEPCTAPGCSEWKATSNQKYCGVHSKEAKERRRALRARGTGKPYTRELILDPRGSLCGVSFCTREAQHRGVCKGHYAQYRTSQGTKEFTPLKELSDNSGNCPGPECTRKAVSRGLCSTHYHQQRTGKKLTPIRPRGKAGGSDYGPNRHGYYATYSNYGCKCQLCTIAWNSYCAGRRAGKVSKTKDPKDLPPHVHHGAENAYANYGCRCEVCRQGRSNRVASYRYKITEEDLQALQEKQNGRCACCGNLVDKLVIDHVHATGEIRGLLCHSCNTGIGKLGDNLEGLEKAVAYLQAKE